jgi:hypothetical protein
MSLPLIPQDKANHVIYGALIALCGAIAAVQLGHPELAGWMANGVALAAGAVKELTDWLANRAAAAAHLPPPHSVELLDLAATWCGGLFAQALLWVVVP